MRKFYYIDDELDTIKAIVDGINVSNIVTVDVFPLSGYKEFEKLIGKICDDWDSFDGLILDLKLDGGGIVGIKFTATSLAQWISSYVITEGKPAKPIVLLSNDLQCAKYKADTTSHDLFDMVLERNGKLDWTWLAKTLNVLAEDYEKLNNDKEKNLKGLLQCESIDRGSTFFAPFLDRTAFNVSQFASFILNDLFKHPGLLISENLVAARYGVDKEKSGKAWHDFKDKYLGVARYRGIFCRLVELYWSKKTQEVFAELSGGRSSVSMTTTQRVRVLKEKVEEAQELIAYEPDDEAASTYCWAIDEVTGKPLDSSDGYMIQEDGGLKSWQEPRFLSFDTIESGNKGDYTLVPSERERFEDDLATLDD